MIYLYFLTFVKLCLLGPECGLFGDCPSEFEKNVYSSVVGWCVIDVSLIRLIDHAVQFKFVPADYLPAGSVD